MDYSKHHRFTFCHVRVEAKDGRISLSAGATMTPEQTLDLIESLLAARHVTVALTAGSISTEEYDADEQEIDRLREAAEKAAETFEEFAWALRLLGHHMMAEAAEIAGRAMREATGPEEPDAA